MRRPHPASRTAAALVIVALGTATGCGAAAWPEVSGIADPGFASGASGPRTIDVLPVDVQLWSHDQRDPVAMAAALDAMVGGTLAAEFGRRGYAIGAYIDWSGDYLAPDGERRAAMPADEVAHTAYALSSYGAAQATFDQRALLVPFLPHRLGQASGADATLYVGGWAFAGKAPTSTARKVGKVLLVTALIAVVVVLAIATIKDGGGGLGNVAAGAGRAAAATGRVAGQVLGGAGRALIHTAGRVAVGGVRLSVNAAELVLQDGDGMVRLIDALGHHETHIAREARRPDYHAQPAAPRRGRSELFLEMTLIDNATGRALWHARQRFVADPTRPADVDRAVARMLARLPAR